jgi:hypothetical protein
MAAAMMPQAMLIRKMLVFFNLKFHRLEVHDDSDSSRLKFFNGLINYYFFQYSLINETIFLMIQNFRRKTSSWAKFGDIIYIYIYIYTRRLHSDLFNVGDSAWSL